MIHRGRALPVVWRIMKHESASISFADYQEMIKQAQTRLPKSVKVVLLADRGFVHTELMKMLTVQLGWHYHIRIKSNTWIWRGNWCQPKNFHLSLGEAICLHNVRIHKGEFYGIVHVIIGRNNVNGELWTIVSDEKTTLQTFAEYGLRFDIEENFLDDQSGILRKKYPQEMAQHYWGKNAKLWHDSKCIISCGGAPLEVIKQYIDNQSGGKE